MTYDRWKAVDYAHKWARKRNHAYLDFSGLGGDCTNFISQCLYAGGAQMHYRKDTGWYYYSAADRAPAWTGVNYLYRFLIKNKGSGPYGTETTAAEIEIGDIVQLSFGSNIFSHSLIVVSINGIPSAESIFVATHSDDSDHRLLSSYELAVDMRFLKIGAR